MVSLFPFISVVSIELSKIQFPSHPSIYFVLFNLFVLFVLKNSLVNASNGYIDNRLKYIRRCGQPEESVVNTPSSTQGNIENMEENIEWLKAVVVSNENMDSIKKMLIATLDHRTQMLRNKQLFFRIEFPFFFTNPYLVCIYNKREGFLQNSSRIHNNFDLFLTRFFLIMV